jgi:transposase InsO family protein
MAWENGWGAPRIHGELLKLGLLVDERTVSRYLPRGRISPDQIQRWLVFLRNHLDGLVGMDFFTVPTVTFGLLWVFAVLHHERRQILHFGVTDHPDASWITQQLREGFPFGTAPRYAILDRDGKYGHAVPVALQTIGVKAVRTAPRSPWQNPYVERFGGTLRRELLDIHTPLGQWTPPSLRSPGGRLRQNFPLLCLGPKSGPSALWMHHVSTGWPGCPRWRPHAPDFYTACSRPAMVRIGNPSFKRANLAPRLSFRYRQAVTTCRGRAGQTESSVGAGTK